MPLYPTRSLTVGTCRLTGTRPGPAAQGRRAVTPVSEPSACRRHATAATTRSSSTCSFALSTFAPATLNDSDTEPSSSMKSSDAVREPGMRIDLQLHRAVPP